MPSRPRAPGSHFARAAWCGAALSVLAGCGDLGRELDDDYVTAEIVQLYGRPGSAQLELGVGSCNRQPRVDVVETGTEVRVTASAQRPGPGGENDCLDSLTIELEDALGSRKVVDDATGAVLHVLPRE